MSVYSRPAVSSGLWCMSIQTPGVVLQGIDVYKQWCYVVLNTPIGSDPLRPLFGCDWAKQIDGNSITSAANIKKEIIDAITIWVPQVTLGKITYMIAAGQVAITIPITVAGSSSTLQLTAAVFTGVTGTLIVDATLPYLRGGYAYVVTVTVGGVSTTSTDLFDIAALLAYVRGAFGYIGQWTAGKDALIVYVKNGIQDVDLNVIAHLRTRSYDDNYDANYG